MFDHIGLRVKDLDASVRFYTVALAPLGYEATSQDESTAAFGSHGNSSLWLYADAKLAHSLVHLAFTAGSRAGGDAVPRAGLQARGRDNGAPAARRDHRPRYYRAVPFAPQRDKRQAGGGE